MFGYEHLTSETVNAEKAYLTKFLNTEIGKYLNSFGYTIEVHFAKYNIGIIELFKKDTRIIHKFFDTKLIVSETDEQIEYDMDMLIGQCLLSNELTSFKTCYDGFII